MKLCFPKAKKKNRSEICCRFLQTIGLGSSKENSGTHLTSLPPQMQQRLVLSNFYLFYLFFLFTYSQKCGKGSYCLQFLHILSGFYILLQIVTYSQIQQGLLISPMLTYSIYVSFSGGRFSLDVCHIYLHGHTHP